MEHSTPEVAAAPHSEGDAERQAIVPTRRFEGCGHIVGTANCTPAKPTCRRGTPQPPPLTPTTSFLTAATLIYALGAGITAGAGTRLVLQ